MRRVAFFLQMLPTGVPQQTQQTGVSCWLRIKANQKEGSNHLSDCPGPLVRTVLGSALKFFGSGRFRRRIHRVTFRTMNMLLSTVFGRTWCFLIFCFSRMRFPRSFCGLFLPFAPHLTCQFLGRVWTHRRIMRTIVPCCSLSLDYELSQANFPVS